MNLYVNISLNPASSKSQNIWVYVFLEYSVFSVSDHRSLWGRAGEITVINIDHGFAAASFPRKWPLLQAVGPHLKTESGVKTEDFLLGDYLQPPHHPFSF